MAETENVVIVGAGLTGASAARELRERGFTGRIQLIGTETHLPYIRPPLSKDYLAGSSDRQSVFVEDSTWYSTNEVEVLTDTTVTSVDAATNRVGTSSGAAAEFDALLLATGSEPRRLDVPGADLAGVHTLRTLDDSDRLRALLAEGGRNLVVVGSGWIGMEVAATARTLGNAVTVLARGIPLAHALGDELGQFFTDLHTGNGVTIRVGVEVAEIHGDGGRVSAVQTRDGESIPADVVVVGIGAAPRLTLGNALGLDIDNGVLVDAFLRSSEPHIFAAGDIANAFHPLIEARIRSEHWANAMNSGRAAARSMLGETVVYDEIPYFYTDQFDVSMEYAGFDPLARDADIVYRGSRQGREFVAFWVADNRVVAGMSVNMSDVMDSIQTLIREASPVDIRKLADATVPLEQR